MLSLAIRNLRRRPARSAALALGIASLAATAFLISALFVSSHQSVIRSGERLGADAVVVPRGAGTAYTSGQAILTGMPSGAFLDSSLIDGLEARDDIRAATGQLFIISARLTCCTVGDTLLVGFDPQRDFTVRSWLRDTLNRPLAPDEVVAGADILSEPGGRMSFFGSLFRLAAKLEPTGIKAMDRAIFIPMTGARRMIAASAQKAEQPLEIGPDTISAVFLRFARGVDHERAAIRIEYEHPEVEVVLAGRALTAARQKLSAPLWAMIAAGALQWAAVLVLAAVLFSLSIGERGREAGVMRAMGATRGHLLRMFFAEALAVSALGALAGVAGGVFGLYLFQDFLRLAMQGAFLMPDAGVLLALALAAVVISVLAGLLTSARAALRASRRSIHSVLTA